MLSRVLYEKRFFPFYTFNIIVGNDNGVPKIWGYDAVGSYGTSIANCVGNGVHFLQTFLDNQFMGYHDIEKKAPLSQEEAIEVVVDAFQNTAERDTTCGDGIELFVLKGDKLLLTKNYPLRRD